MERRSESEFQVPSSRFKVDGTVKSQKYADFP
jgi:hypothetical protein